MADSSDDDSGHEDGSGGSKDMGAIGKDPVHKCFSDPCKKTATTPTTRVIKYPSGVTRKCLLTLDGYSYVIGEHYLLIIFFCVCYYRSRLHLRL